MVLWSKGHVCGLGRLHLHAMWNAFQKPKAELVARMVKVLGLSLIQSSSSELSLESERQQLCQH